MIDSWTHHRLIRWGRWASGSLRGPPEPRCGSAEARWLPVAGSLYLSAVEALEQSLRHLPPSLEDDNLAVELVVMRLPVRFRLAVRLDYVWHKRLTLRQKTQALGCYEGEFMGLVEAAAGRIRLGLSGQ